MLQKHRIPLMSFQLTAVRRRLLAAIKLTRQFGLFQLTAARRRLLTDNEHDLAVLRVSTHSRPKAAALWPCRYLVGLPVSTHSRPKAAAQTGCRAWRARQCFNSQPPEGGCGQRYDQRPFRYRFNSQPPEGGCAEAFKAALANEVSTHSRPKAAA